MKTNYLDIFKQLNRIPRPSHHEERVADFLCDFAREHGLKYRRDAQNCVVIEKPATPGYEDTEPVVILNHMDMVCVARNDYQRDGRTFDPLNDEIIPYIEKVKNSEGKEERWMKAEGTSLGADNGIGLSMALAILADDSIVHPPLEVLTTTNEEDGMSGAEALTTDFIRGRKVINLDSEAYNEITVGAAGACLQVGRWETVMKDVPSDYKAVRIAMSGGLGGHSGVDINKERCNCIKDLSVMVYESLLNKNENHEDEVGPILICDMKGGTANASIASCAEMVLAFKDSLSGRVEEMVREAQKMLSERYHDTDPGVVISMEETTTPKTFIANAMEIVACICRLPFGVMEMRKDMPGTVMTSNNIGVLDHTDNAITLSCHTRSFSNADQRQLADRIKDLMTENNATEVKELMDTAAWMEKDDSPLLSLTCKTFSDILGFEPKKVAMHFVLEAAYYVEKYPGVEIASIGPLIIEPHSTSERVNLDTADNIWKVTIELLRRLASPKTEVKNDEPTSEKDTLTDTDRHFMQMAIDASVENVRNGGGPFGAVIVRNGTVISTGVNRVTSSNDPTAHAEVSAIREACKKLGNFKLDECVIYTSCEPCPMCLSAIYWSGIRKIYYGNTATDAKNIDFDDQFIYDELALPPARRSIPSINMMRTEAQRAFKEWSDKSDKIKY